MADGCGLQRARLGERRPSGGGKLLAGRGIDIVDDSLSIDGDAADSLPKPEATAPHPATSLTGCLTDARSRYPDQEEDNQPASRKMMMRAVEHGKASEREGRSTNVDASRGRFWRQTRSSAGKHALFVFLATLSTVSPMLWILMGHGC